MFGICETYFNLVLVELCCCDQYREVSNFFFHVTVGSDFCPSWKISTTTGQFAMTFVIPLTNTDKIP